MTQAKPVDYKELAKKSIEEAYETIFSGNYEKKSLRTPIVQSLRYLQDGKLQPEDIDKEIEDYILAFLLTETGVELIIMSLCSIGIDPKKVAELINCVSKKGWIPKNTTDKNQKLIHTVLLLQNLAIFSHLLRIKAPKTQIDDTKQTILHHAKAQNNNEEKNDTIIASAYERLVESKAPPEDIYKLLVFLMDELFGSQTDVKNFPNVHRDAFMNFNIKMVLKRPQEEVVTGLERVLVEVKQKQQTLEEYGISKEAILYHLDEMGIALEEMQRLFKIIDIEPEKIAKLLNEINKNAWMIPNATDEEQSNIHLQIAVNQLIKFTMLKKQKAPTNDMVLVFENMLKNLAAGKWKLEDIGIDIETIVGELLLIKVKPEEIARLLDILNIPQTVSAVLISQLSQNIARNQAKNN